MSQRSSPHSHRWLREAQKAGWPMLASQRRPLLHNLLNAGVLVCIVGWIGLTTALSTVLPPMAFVLFGGLAYGLAFYTCLGVVVHEASHRMFFISRSPRRAQRANRAVGWACSLPFAVHYIRHWEKGHAVHHTRPFEPDDPQAFNAATGRPLLRTLLLLVLVPGYFLAHRLLRKRASGPGGSSRNVMIFFALFWLALGFLTVSTLGGHVLLALIFGLQVLSALNQVKGALEHGGPLTQSPDPLLRSRNTLFTGWPLFWPFFVSLFHFEHHLLPGVPWYALPRYHRAVRAIVPAALHENIFNRALLQQLAGRVGPIPTDL